MFTKSIQLQFLSISSKATDSPTPNISNVVKELLAPSAQDGTKSFIHCSWPGCGRPAAPSHTLQTAEFAMSCSWSNEPYSNPFAPGWQTNIFRKPFVSPTRPQWELLRNKHLMTYLFAFSTPFCLAIFDRRGKKYMCMIDHRSMHSI